MRPYYSILISMVFSMTSSGYELHRQDWKEWKNLYRKSYSVEEELARFLTWEKNNVKIAQHNAEFGQGLHSYKLEANMFADKTANDENQDHPAVLPYRSHPCNATSYFNTLQVIPDSIDWRKKGAITPVQNQGGVGQSWTFSATGALEAQNYMKSGKLIKLSEQNLVDCANTDFSLFCAVGSPECAFYYVIKNNGIDTAEGYPGKQDGRCHFDSESVGGTCKECFTLPTGNEEALQRALLTVGPVAAVIDAGLPSFQLYKAGIYDDPNCGKSLNLNHDILVVGYGTEEGMDFWIVKNSWGQAWGEQGYIRIARNHGNICGIATAASYPVA